MGGTIGRSRRVAGRALFGALGALFFGVGVGVLGGWALQRAVERRVRSRLEDIAARADVRLRIGRVSFSFVGPLELYDVEAGRPGRFEAAARRVSISWRLFEPSLLARVRRIHLEGASLALPNELSVALADSTWDVLRLSPGALALRRHGTDERLEAEWERHAGRLGGRVRFASLDAGGLFRIERGGRPLVDPGRLDGRLRVVEEGSDRRDGFFRVELAGRTRGLRLPNLGGDDPVAGGANGEAEEPAFGAPTDLDVALDGTFDAGGHGAEISCFRLEADGVTMSGEGSGVSGENDLWLRLRLDVPRVDLSRVLAASGVPLAAGGAALPADLGSASLRMRVEGHLLDPASMLVEPRLDFRPPPGGVPALAYLKGPFTQTVGGPRGSCTLEVRPGSPDFVALDEVPPLFLKTLLISEDAGFYGHPGVDLAEIPVALATNWARGERARGASTITQQLAKNLFLSRQKSMRRKVQELALTLLLESELGKRRILEIYLNVIEWGPGVYGLRSAARHYFGREPRDLTPKETVFLVSLIPGPVKYQRSIASGTVSPRFNTLLVRLLAKLRSVDALSEEEYEGALGEELTFRRSPP